MRITQNPTQWIGRLSLLLIIAVMGVSSWLAMEDYNVHYSHTGIMAQSAYASTEQGDMAESLIALAADKSFYLPYGSFSQERLLAMSEIQPEDVTVNVDEEFYLPYGEFSNDHLYGHLSRANTPDGEILADNALTFINGGGQCSFGKHGGVVAFNSEQDCL